MSIQNKFLSSAQFFIASVFLFIALLSFLSATDYRGLENNFLADNWGTPLVIFLILTFAVGWWTEGLMEYTLMSTSRMVSVVIFVILVVIFVFIGLASFWYSGFTSYALRACGYILFSGFFYRFSVLRSEVMNKLRNRK